MRQASLAIETPPAEHDLAFAIGWDHAHHAVAPPLPRLQASLALRRGWEAGRATFGAHTLPASPGVRRWLQLRLSGWRRGIAFEGLLVTPNYLRQIEVAWCPVMRVALTLAGSEADDASVDRVRDDAGYAAGNLAVMSAFANAAKGSSGFDEALARMRAAESAAAGEQGLDAAQWTRVALLCSFVTALPHAQAAALPMRLLPPNRLRLLNPIQALQALATRQLGQPGWSGRIARLEALIPGATARLDFQRFVHALWPRVHECGRHARAESLRWALEDAWACPRVLRCWSRFASALTADQAQQIVLRACARRGEAMPWALGCTLEEATQGWNLQAAPALQASADRDRPKPGASSRRSEPWRVPRSRDNAVRMPCGA